MDPLTEQLMQRAMGQQTPASPQPAQQGTPTPAVPPSGGQTHTPPELQRFINAQKMMQAYRNNWTPNPMLLQAASR